MAKIMTVKVERDRPNIAKSRVDLANELGIHRRTLENYDKLARAYIADYLELCKGKIVNLGMQSFGSDSIRHLSQR